VDAVKVEGMVYQRPFDVDQYTWSQGKLYEFIDGIFGDDDVWLQSDMYVEVDYLINNASAVRFVPIPETRKVF
jgi:hypothetical protein